MDPNQAFQETLDTLETFIGVFDANSDVDVLRRIANRQSRLREARQTSLDAAKELLERDTSELALLEKTVAEIETSETVIQNAKEIRNLESEKFSAVKAINELENAVDVNELRLQQLRDELELLENEDPMTGALTHTDSADILKLNLYHKMGVTTDSPDDPTKITKLMVKGSRPEKMGTINSLNLSVSDHKYGEKFVSDFVWENI
ncbi:hypothetical protein NADFUDRAFT_52932 [Nadsonia fulvescens var. elongata DSM 6958]|uniref:Kinetochore protein Spc24 n=1 Tax=Nadsonia fulvescens var. elongata DSM 6958 TaxID=857566 RepID=A0A1E3PGG1_9ASCO|nr:hypothetical protein NADFUDRAFT_52932 [Nadsonia fulvescens var. elongata DSM 6958]